MSEGTGNHVILIHFHQEKTNKSNLRISQPLAQLYTPLCINRAYHGVSALSTFLYNPIYKNDQYSAGRDNTSQLHQLPQVLRIPDPWAKSHQLPLSVTTLA